MSHDTTRISLNYSVKIFLVVMTFGNFLSMALSYVLVNYLGASNSLGQLSISDDKIGYLPELQKHPHRYSFGSHFFGDFLEPFLKTLSRSPYTHLLDGHKVSNYPPFAHLILFPFTWMPYFAALFSYVTTSLLFVLVPLWRLTRSLVLLERITFVTLIGFSVPVLFAIDRGNLWAITIGLLLFFFWCLESGHEKSAAVLLATATAIKISPIIFFVWLSKRTQKMTVIFGLAFGLSVTMVSLFFFKGQPVDNFIAFINSQKDVHGNVQSNFLFQRLNNSLISLGNNLWKSNVGAFRLVGSVVVESYWLYTVALVVIAYQSFKRLVITPLNEFYLLTGLCSFICLISPTIFTYELIIFLIPLMKLASLGPNQNSEKVFAVLIGLLFVNKVPFTPSISVVTAMNTVNPLLNILILSISLQKIYRLNEIRQTL
jgi:hypothetical protein